MTTFLMPTSSDVERDPLAGRTVGYFRANARNEFHQVVLREFIRLRDEVGLKQSDIVRRLSSRADQISRSLGAPGNWTIDTISDLLLAMRLRPVLLAMPLDDEVAVPATLAKQKVRPVGAPIPESSANTDGGPPTAGSLSGRPLRLVEGKMVANG